MIITKEKLSDYKEKYEEVENLVEVDSKHDPPSEPFRSHYKARDILIEMQNNLKNVLNDLSEDDENIRVYQYILGFIYKDTGRICIWTEELANGEVYLMKCLELLSPYQMNPEAINAYLGALNQIGILWSNRNDARKSQEYLEKSENMYYEFKATNQSPLTIYDIFASSKDDIERGKGLDMLEKTHTLTLYYLAQILGTLGDLHKSASLCHQTLKRQLEFDDYEPIDWSLNAATLSQYFFQNCRNTESRHHLAAASYIMGKYESQMLHPDMNDDQKGAVLEIFNHRSADINRCWAKYGLNLLSESRNRLMSDEDDDDKGTIEKGIQNVRLTDLCKFEGLDVSPFEELVTDQYILMFDDAKPVFMAIQNWLNKAKEYYTMESEASEYAKVVQDQALAYKYLAFYDFDEGNQCKLHKRGADLLEELLKMNPTYYLNVCREVWFELGSIYSKMMDIKFDVFEKLKIQENPRPHVLNKINMLCQKSINKFQDFIDSYCDKDTKELLTNIPMDEMEPIMFAYFHIGRLYYKKIVPEKNAQIVNVTNCLKYYTLFIKSYEGNKSLADRLKSEYGVCREMAELLPLKINKLRCEVDATC